MPLNIKPLGGSDKWKKLPGSKKFADVKATINSGFNEIKQRVEETERQQNARFHRGSNFQRLTVKQLVQLSEASDVELLILDLRDEDEYEKSRLAPAWSYPVRLLSRAVNPFTPEILAFRNRAPGRIIVLYDSCEESSAAAANLMFEKGTDNVFIVTGGLRAVQQQQPDMVEGPEGDLHASKIAARQTHRASLSGKENGQISTARWKTAGLPDVLPIWK